MLNKPSSQERFSFARAILSTRRVACSLRVPVAPDSAFLVSSFKTRLLFVVVD
jgi:hypothetical protein